jgi:hypothetical protein
VRILNSTKSKSILGIILVFMLFLMLFHNTAVMQSYAQDTDDRQWFKLGVNRISRWAFSPEYETDRVVFIITNATEKMSVRGVYRSDDAGDTWIDSSEGLIPKKRHYFTSLLISPQFSEDLTLWLFGRKTGLTVDEAFGGFWESTDGAQLWTEIDYLGFPYREMTRRVSQDIIGAVNSIHINEDGLIVAAVAGEGVYQSRDKGRNWELLSPVKDVTDIFAPGNFPDENFLALATTGSQVMISTDGGISFESRGNGLPSNMKSVRGVAFSDNFTEDRTMFVFGSGGVFVSRDAGMIWELLAAPDPNVRIEAMDVIGDFKDNGAIAYGTDVKTIYLSDDMGTTFTSIGSETVMNYGVDTLSFAPDYFITGDLFASSQDGIFRFGSAVDEAAQAAAQAHAIEVEGTRVARATALAVMEFIPEQSDRVETGCIAYAPVLTLGIVGLVLVVRRSARKGS